MQRKPPPLLDENIDRVWVAADVARGLATPGSRSMLRGCHGESRSGAWITGLVILDGGAVQFPRRAAKCRSQSDPRDARRLAVLKAAAAFGASRPDVKSADVLTIADRWLAWVETPRST
jgi:hypothetical protein